MKAAPRFILARPPDEHGIVSIDGAEFHHLRRVMRLRPGARLTLIDGSGAEFDAELIGCDARRATARLLAHKTPRAAPRIILAPAIVKGARMDFLIEKAAELGAAELWPLTSERSVVRAPGGERLARWRRLAAAAAKQSLAPRPMTVADPLALPRLIESAPRDTLAVMCAVGAPPLGALIRARKPEMMLIACGPEGGFSDAELARAADAGFERAGLGPRRLRAETAALAALAIAAAALDELARGV
jgi:16S rRNA (uracil1498-N3)-methyltransferase